VNSHKKTQTKSFFENREKTMKIACKGRHFNHLHFSRGPEKGVKISYLVLLLKKCGTSDKKRAKCPFFNDFCVPQNAWDKPGTRLRQSMRRDNDSF